MSFASTWKTLVGAPQFIGMQDMLLYQQRSAMSKWARDCPDVSARDWKRVFASDSVAVSNNDDDIDADEPTGVSRKKLKISRGKHAKAANPPEIPFHDALADPAEESDEEESLRNRQVELDLFSVNAAGSVAVRNRKKQSTKANSNPLVVSEDPAQMETSIVMHGAQEMDNSCELALDNESILQLSKHCDDANASGVSLDQVSESSSSSMEADDNEHAFTPLVSNHNASATESVLSRILGKGKSSSTQLETSLGAVNAADKDVSVDEKESDEPECIEQRVHLDPPSELQKSNLSFASDRSLPTPPPVNSRRLMTPQQQIQHQPTRKSDLSGRSAGTAKSATSVRHSTSMKARSSPANHSILSDRTVDGALLLSPVRAKRTPSPKRKKSPSDQEGGDSKKACLLKNSNSVVNVATAFASRLAQHTRNFWAAPFANSPRVSMRLVPSVTPLAVHETTTTTASKPVDAFSPPTAQVVKAVAQTEIVMESVTAAASTDMPQSLPPIVEAIGSTTTTEAEIVGQPVGDQQLSTAVQEQHAPDVGVEVAIQEEEAEQMNQSTNIDNNSHSILTASSVYLD